MKNLAIEMLLENGALNIKGLGSFLFKKSSVRLDAERSTITGPQYSFQFQEEFQEGAPYLHEHASKQEYETWFVHLEKELTNREGAEVLTGLWLAKTIDGVKWVRQEGIFSSSLFRTVDLENRTTTTPAVGASKMFAFWSVLGVLPLLIGGYFYLFGLSGISLGKYHSAEYSNPTTSDTSQNVMKNYDGLDSSFSSNNDSDHSFLESNLKPSKEIPDNSDIDFSNVLELNSESKEQSSAVANASELQAQERFYGVVNGVFESRFAAEQRQYDLKSVGFENPSILKRGKRYFLVFKKFANKKDAEDFARTLRGEYPETWVKEF